MALKSQPWINLDSLRRSCCWAHWKESRRHSEVPTRLKNFDRHGHNHPHSPASEHYHSLEVSFLGHQSRLEVDSSCARRGLVLPWGIDGLAGMPTSSWPSWKNEGHLVGSWLQAHRCTGEIHTQAMPAESLVFVAAEENIRRTDRLEDDLYPTSQSCISRSLYQPLHQFTTSYLHYTSKDGH